MIDALPHTPAFDLPGWASDEQTAHQHEPNAAGPPPDWMTANASPSGATVVPVVEESLASA
ncbi:hypothetical protein AB0J35_43455 [Nonomuraea angiospora]|uniref:hypothetical protein n=1 Tax=Nonomuraea angiospora TaxID=46172 RepID=UPI00342B490D